MNNRMQFGMILVLAAGGMAQPTFKSSELLGRVTDSSVTVNLAADRDLDAYIEYGTTSGAYSGKTTAARYTGGTPFEIVLDGLKSNTGYYYRMQYREPGATAFTARAEHTFQTQRQRGSSFTFAVQFDPHMDDNSDPETYRLTLANAFADKPDFLIDLGDNMMSDKLQQPTAATVLDRVLLLRSYYDLICHSAPLYLVLGNHEGEWGRFLDGTANNVAVWDTQYRKQYYPNPIPDRFYSGDTRTFPIVGQRQAYYSWEWGDALFVALDPYWNQPSSPDASGDWSLTLGREQYAWLKKTLETSTATFKFVFCHNLVGGLNMNGPMRGGIETAKYLEWGGYSLDGTWGFDKARPGWAMPIHQLLVANNVTAFFHGHDHLYAKQDLDGIVYQEGPQPSARNTMLGNRATDYAYTHGTMLGGTGYLRVQVSPAAVKVEYVQTWTPANENTSRKNGMVADSYTIPARRADLKAVSGASYSGGTVAPDSIVSAFGESLSPGPVTVTDSAGAARVAEVLGAVSTQVSFVVPSATAPGRAQFAIGDGLGALLVEPVAPGFFSANANGQGVAAALAVHVENGGVQSVAPIFQCDASGCFSTPLDLGPASEQVYLSLFGTGMRHYSIQASATVGGASVAVAGPVAQSQFAGLDQVNLGPLPRSLAGRGEVDVILTVDGKAANTVTVNLK